MILGFESFAVLTEMGLSPLFFLNCTRIYTTISCSLFVLYNNNESSSSTIVCNWTQIHFCTIDRVRTVKIATGHDL